MLQIVLCKYGCAFPTPKQIDCHNVAVKDLDCAVFASHCTYYRGRTVFHTWIRRLVTFLQQKRLNLSERRSSTKKQRFINGTYNTGIEITLKIRQKLPIFLLFALRAVLLCKFFADVLDVDCWCLYNFRIEYRFNGKIRAELAGFSWSSGNTSAVHFSPPLASSAAISISRMKKRQVLDCRANLI
jgi:hypothetical protein